MSFVSYAQNLEDLMLWRALQNIQEGFYVDVGANDPELDSVTKAFYDRGWHGINVEPVDQWFRRLEQQRPRDINLQLAAGNQQGTLVMYELQDTGLSTLDKGTAERHETERGYKKVERKVSVETLTSICERHDATVIHFLKIDVEGAEKAVLEGLDFTRFRPWIVVVESTLPNTQMDDHSRWNSIIEGVGYESVYFDGLNRYFIAHEHSELKKCFATPPNVFDNYVFGREVEIKEKADKAESRATRAESRATRAESRATRAESRATRAESHVAALMQSRSWRVTAPMRWVSLQLHLLKSLGIKARCKAAIKRLIRSLASFADGHSGVRALAMAVLDRFPALESQIKRIVVSGHTINAGTPAGGRVPPEERGLTPRARQIRADLLVAVQAERESR